MSAFWITVLCLGCFQLGALFVLVALWWMGARPNNYPPMKTWKCNFSAKAKNRGDGKPTNFSYRRTGITIKAVSREDVFRQLYDEYSDLHECSIMEIQDKQA